MNIKFDYCKCIRKYGKAHLRSDFWQSKHLSTYYKSITLVEGVSYNEWSLVESGYNTFKQQYNKFFLTFSNLFIKGH